MAHELDLSRGRAAMAYVGERPWHKLGQQLEVGRPIEEWLVAAGLDWSLERLPVQYLVDGYTRTMEDRFVLARSDTREALSVVSGDYRVVQPREVLEFYRELVSAHGYQLETAGALNGGRKVWGMARTGRTGAVGADDSDPVAAYVLLATSCDKSLATTVAFTSVRVVCQNTLGFAMDDVRANRRPHVKVPHTRTFDSDEVHKQLGLLDTAWARFLARAKALAEVPCTPIDANRYFERVLLRTAPRRGDKEPVLSLRSRSDRESLNALFRSAPGQDVAPGKETLWGALNAVTYFVDHVRAGSAASRIDSAWFGAGRDLKQAAWEETESMISAS